MSLTFKQSLRRVLMALAVLALVCFLPGVSSAHPAHIAHPDVTSAPQLKVVGNQLVDKNTLGVVTLHGVNREGSEYACEDAGSTWDHNYHVFPDQFGPTQAEITSMLQWHINAVRIPLNEDCWLNVEMPQGDNIGGATYINGITGFVNLLNLNGMVAILDLQYSAPAPERATSLESMPDASYSAAFWASVASTFAGNDGVLFDVFNEPSPPNQGNYDPATWTCWLKGQTTQGDSSNACAAGCPDWYQAAQGTQKNFDCVGMQALVDAVRGAASPSPDNVILLGGADSAKWFNHWSEYLPKDPHTGQNYTNLAVSGHLYWYWPYDQADLTQQIANGYPLIAGEIGGGPVGSLGTSDVFLLPTMQYLDNPKGDGSLPAQSYLAWQWNPDNGQHMALITNYQTGNPTSCYGQEYQAHLTGGTDLNC